MDASTVRRVMDLIPERVARVQSGTMFAAAVPCRYPERVAHIARFLHWLSPLEELTREDQQVLGLLNAAGRPVHAADLEDEDEEEMQAEPSERTVQPFEEDAAVENPPEEEVAIA